LFVRHVALLPAHFVIFLTAAVPIDDDEKASRRVRPTVPVARRALDTIERRSNGGELCFPELGSS
jgi:hypothetical protein